MSEKQKKPSIFRLSSVDETVKKNCSKNIGKINRNRWIMTTLIIGMIAFGITATIIISYDAESVIIVEHMDEIEATEFFMPDEPIPVDYNDTSHDYIYVSSDNITSISINNIIFMVYDENAFVSLSNYSELFYFMYTRIMLAMVSMTAPPVINNTEMQQKTNGLKSAIVFDETSFMDVDASPVIRVPRELFGNTQLYVCPIYIVDFHIGEEENAPKYSRTIILIDSYAEAQELKVGYGTNSYTLESLEWDIDGLKHEIDNPFDWTNTTQGTVTEVDYYHNGLQNLFLSPTEF